MTSPPNPSTAGEAEGLSDGERALWDALDNAPLAHSHTEAGLIERIRTRSPEYALAYVRGVVEYSCFEAVRKHLRRPSGWQPIESVIEAARRVIAERMSSVTDRDGRQHGMEDDRGEKLWLVPFEVLLELERALKDFTEGDRK